MAKTRKVRDPQPGTRNHYIVDACFLANWAIPPTVVPHKEQYRHESCMKWWAMIEHQVKTGKARIYAPDICIWCAARFPETPVWDSRAQCTTP